MEGGFTGMEGGFTGMEGGFTGGGGLGQHVRLHEAALGGQRQERQERQATNEQNSAGGCEKKKRLTEFNRRIVSTYRN
eukprot:8303378-Pyramimonas_sp.AAC.1